MIQKTYRILISNDDGYKSEGIQELFRALKEAGHHVVMIAPERERSTMSHALTLHKPLRMIRVDEDQYYLSGTPADCIHVGLRYQWDFKPELVISGINRGANLGSDVHYSGTVSCAREAVLNGTPAIAVSLVLQHTNTKEEKEYAKKHQHFETASRVVVDALPHLDRFKEFPNHLININAPNVPPSKLKGVRLGFLGNRRYEGELVNREDPRGRPYMWVGGKYSGYDSVEGSDNDLIAAGFAALTPINLDPTDYELLEKMKSWKVER